MTCHHIESDAVNNKYSKCPKRGQKVFTLDTLGLRVASCLCVNTSLVDLSDSLACCVTITAGEDVQVFEARRRAEEMEEEDSSEAARRLVQHRAFGLMASAYARVACAENLCVNIEFGFIFHSVQTEIVDS